VVPAPRSRIGDKAAWHSLRQQAAVPRSISAVGSWPGEKATGAGDVEVFTNISIIGRTPPADRRCSEIGHAS